MAIAVYEFYKFVNLLAAELFPVDEKFYHRRARAAKERLLHIFHHHACVLGAGNKRVVCESLSLELAVAHKLLVVENLKKRSHGAVCGLGLVVAFNNVVYASAAIELPQDVHHLHFGFRQCLELSHVIRFLSVSKVNLKV